MPEKLVIDCSRWRSGELTLIAPNLLLAEFASLLAKRSRRKELSEQQSKLAFQLMVRSSPILYDMRPLLPLALDLSLQHQFLYGTLYIWPLRSNIIAPSSLPTLASSAAAGPITRQSAY